MSKKRAKRLLIKSNKHFKCLHFFADKNIKTEFKQLKPKSKIQIAERKKAKRKKILNICMFTLNIVILAVVLAVSLTQQDIKTVLAPQIEWKYIAIIIGIVLLTIILDSLKYFILIKSSTKKSRPFLSYKVSALGRYYDSVTPMSSGGQPFQMMYLNKRGIKGNVATSIPLMKYIFWQIIYVIVCTVILLCNQISSVGQTGTFVTAVAWISVLGNLAIVSTVFLLSISKKVGPLIVIWCLKLLSKLKIVKNYQKTFRSVMRFVINYQKTIKFFAKNFFVMVSELLLAVIDIFLYNIIPYFVYKAFLPMGTMNWLDIFTQSIICNLTLGFIPTPGASGGAEGVFSIIFGGAFSKSGLFWPVLIWRISTYYIYLLQGLFVLVYDFVIGNKKAEKLKAQGIGVYALDEKPSFRQTLKENRNTIEIVQNQEEDKLVVSMFKQSKNYDLQEQEEIISDGDIVTTEEMNQEVASSEEVLKDVRIKDIKRKKAKKLKKQAKIEKNNNKNSKK